MPRYNNFELDKVMKVMIENLKPGTIAMFRYNLRLDLKKKHYF
jgi:hypothetical protein